MTYDEEEKFIKKELEWTARVAEEKRQDMVLAEKRYREAQFRALITQKALDEFYTNNKKDNGDDNTN
jgi:hypothetical protein